MISMKKLGLVAALSCGILQGCVTAPTQETLNNVGATIAASYRTLAAMRLAISAIYTNGAISADTVRTELLKQAKLRSAIDLSLALSQLQSPLPDLPDVLAAQQADEAALAALRLSVEAQ